jgi:hypothetical protein
VTAIQTAERDIAQNIRFSHSLVTPIQTAERHSTEQNLKTYIWCHFYKFIFLFSLQCI